MFTDFAYIIRLVAVKGCLNFSGIGGGVEFYCLGGGYVFLVLVNEVRKFLLSFHWFGIAFLSAYCMNNEKGINKEGNLTCVLVERRHNVKIEEES